MDGQGIARALRRARDPVQGTRRAARQVPRGYSVRPASSLLQCTTRTCMQRLNDGGWGEGPERGVRACVGVWAVCVLVGYGGRCVCAGGRRWPLAAGSLPGSCPSRRWAPPPGTPGTRRQILVCSSVFWVPVTFDGAEGDKAKEPSESRWPPIPPKPPPPGAYGNE
ncbi:hypothetical protein EDB80DRAFT_832197 [Ilyonectria destructans]|nr:hypothetical protein EDB80DRAFT_832197 [Ilyonectria destructans]